MKKVLLLFSCLCFLSTLSATATKFPVDVDLLVKVFSLRKGEKNPKIHGRFWEPAATTEAKTVLILAPLNHKTYAPIARDLAEDLMKKSVPTLWLEPRESADRMLTTGVEDVQTGIVFLRTDSRVKTSTPPQVVVIAFGEAAVGAAQYAGSNKQVHMLLGGTWLFDPKYKNPQELQGFIDACKPQCNSVPSGKDSSPQKTAARLEKYIAGE